MSANARSRVEVRPDGVLVDGVPVSVLTPEARQDPEVVRSELADYLWQLGPDDQDAAVDALTAEGLIQYRHKGRPVRADGHLKALRRLLRTKPPLEWRWASKQAIKRLSPKPRLAAPAGPPLPTRTGRAKAPGVPRARGRKPARRRSGGERAGPSAGRRGSRVGSQDSEPHLARSAGAAGEFRRAERRAA
jgi:hypothetical protein